VAGSRGRSWYSTISLGSLCIFRLPFPAFGSSNRVNVRLTHPTLRPPPRFALPSAAARILEHGTTADMPRPGHSRAPA
jgi:hypothetical protein